MRQGLGRRQRQVLGDMLRHDGVWPTDWKVNAVTRRILETLEARGLIRSEKLPDRVKYIVTAKAAKVLPVFWK